MCFKELQKLTFILSGCFSVLLVASAFAASLLFNWNAPRTRPGAGLTENCHPSAGQSAQAQTAQDQGPAPMLAAQSDSDGELRPLDPDQEELLNPDTALAPGEVLGLNEELELFGNISKKTEAPTRPKTSATVTSQPEAARAPASPPPAPMPAPAASLEAPAHARPNHKADLRKSALLRLHWDAVHGAADYHVRAWTSQAGIQIVLLDQITTATELRVEPKSGNTVTWQVTARDNSGKSGPTTGPLEIQLLTRNSVKNR
ncbi:MAG: hypothetical protein HY074_07815 [Deltaproteobacteria bacterium]|nr:hypothetical protein [Deltaproteobacteria bacterium]